MIAPSWEEMKDYGDKEKRFFIIDLKIKSEGLLVLEVCLMFLSISEFQMLGS